jgi:hypothetical protein
MIHSMIHYGTMRKIEAKQELRLCHYYCEYIENKIDNCNKYCPYYYK